MVPLLFVIALAQTQPLPQQQGAPSDEPAPAEATASPAAEAKKKDDDDKPAVLKNVDLAITVFNSTGTFFGAEGYTDSFTFWFEPSWAFGKTFFAGTWFEKLAVSARIPVEWQLAGNDSRFSGTGFSSAVLYSPEALPIIETQAGAVSGPTSRNAIMGDTWLSLTHGHLLTVPKLGIEISGGVRTTWPTSIGSRNAGLIAAVAPGLVFERKFFDRLTLGYGFRPTKYFYSRTQGAIAALGTTVNINGNPEQTWTPSSTGIANADYALIDGFWATLELPKGFSIEAYYFLFNTRPYAVTGGCTPIAVPDVNTCRDGAAVGPLNPSPWRNEQWFLASVDYKHSFWSLGLGISTFRPLENVDGTTAQPFYASDRNNYTTLYLSFSANAEGIAAFATEKKQ